MFACFCLRQAGAPLKVIRKEQHEEKKASRVERTAAGVGRGNNPNSHGNKPRKEEMEQRQTVPLPADREVITVQAVRDFLIDPPTTGGENAVHAWTVPPPMPQRVLPPIPVALEASHE